MTVKSFAERRLQQLRYGTSAGVLPNSPLAASGPDDVYGVTSGANGSVVLRLGAVPPFELPRDAAIRLAMLILKHAGVEVDSGNEKQTS